MNVQAIEARGIVIENMSHVLAEDVANMTLGLVLAVTQNLVNADAFVCSGVWSQCGQYTPSRSISHMHVGIVGFGMIGSAIARRLAAYGSRVAY